MVDITVKQQEQWAWVNLDDDGTPLTMHGERMVEVSPGRWEDPIVAAASDYFAAHPLPASPTCAPRPRPDLH